MSIDEPIYGRNSGLNAEHELRQRMARHTRRSFLIGAAAAGATFACYDWLSHARQIGELQSPLRRAEQFNAAISRSLSSDRQLAPTYSRSRSTELRLNNNIGLNTGMILSSWRLQVIGLAHPRQYRQFIEDVDLWDYKSRSSPASSARGSDTPPTAQPPSANSNPNPKLKPGQHIEIHQTLNINIPVAPPSDTTRTPGIVLSMADIQALPFTEQITQFKCIEGWSQITSFAGVRFSDFLKAYPPAHNPDGRPPRYVFMETADGMFSSAFDLASMLHPQTLLCYQMNGKPLSPGHGAPLRLATPFKYGYKQIKQIASLTYTDKRPHDFWSERGYDWYAGL